MRYLNDPVPSKTSSNFHKLDKFDSGENHRVPTRGFRSLKYVFDLPSVDVNFLVAHTVKKRGEILDVPNLAFYQYNKTPSLANFPSEKSLRL
jgi:hypothetical protein